MYHASCYSKYTSPKSLDSVAIANKENAQSPSDHSTTDPNDSYQTWHGLQTSCLNDRGVDHWWCLLFYEFIKPHCAIWLYAPPWIWCGPNSWWCIQPDAKITRMSLKRYTSAQNMPILCQQKRIVPYMWQVTARWSTGKICQSLKSSSHMIKRHFDVTLVFHRPNECTESQYVFSSEVQPGPIIEGCLRLGEAQEREEKSWRWKGVLWWAESWWCIWRDTACVKCDIDSETCHSVAPAHHAAESTDLPTSDEEKMHMFQVSCTIFSHG